MPASITIPISVFEVTVLYDKPDFQLLVNRTQILQELFAAFAEWSPSVDDTEVLNTGKLSDQGARFKISSQSSSFFFGPTSCKFTKDHGNWSEAELVIKLLRLALEALQRSTGVTFGIRSSVLSLHLQPTTVPFRDILRKFIVPEILTLDQEPPLIMAVVTGWRKHRITLDNSAALANGIFLQVEREFEAQTSFEDMMQAIFTDQQQLFKLLDVQEDAS